MEESKVKRKRISLIQRLWFDEDGYTSPIVFYGMVIICLVMFLSTYFPSMLVIAQKVCALIPGMQTPTQFPVSSATDTRDTRIVSGFFLVGFGILIISHIYRIIKERNQENVVPDSHL